MPVVELAEAWERYANKPAAPRRDRNAAGATSWFNWTNHPDHGPTESILEPVGGRTVLELGSGTGGNLAHLATLGAHCTGVDIAPTQKTKAAARWGHLPGLVFEQAEAVDYLTHTERAFDIVFSVFGPVWFNDPDVLLPLIHKRLAPGGLLAFSQTHPDDVEPLPARTRFPRYDLAGHKWVALLDAHGYAGARAEVVEAPEAGGSRTLLVQARTA